MATGDAINGRTNQVQITYGGGSPIVLNGADTVPLRPAMNAPSTEVQPFQEGDYVSVTVDGGYQSDTITCEYRAEQYDTIDENRAKGIVGSVQRLVGGTATGDALNAIVTVSEGPTITVNAVAVPTMTVQFDYVTTKANS